MLILILAFWVSGQRTSALPYGAVIALVVFGPLLLAVLVALFLIGVHDQTRLTALLALFGLLATSMAWAFKKMLDSLQLRAQVLIQELLADGPKPRAEIRAYIYANNVLFRFDKSVYVDALAVLLTAKTVRTIPGGCTN